MGNEIDILDEDKPEPAAPPPRLQAEKYKAHLDEMDLSDHQARELLETLWSIMVTFVDIGWGVDSLTIAMPGIFEAESKDGHTGAITTKEHTTGDTP